MPAKKVSETTVIPVPVTQVAPEVAGGKGKAVPLASTVAKKKADVPAKAPATQATPATTAPTAKVADAKTTAPVSVTQTQVPAQPAQIVDAKDDPQSAEHLLTDLQEKVTSLTGQLKTIQSALKLLAKEFDKQKKIIDKVQKKKEKAKKSPSGFAKPCKISDELCDFIGIAKGTEQSRTDITRFINSYVKQHNLNNPENRREFFPDKKLKAILNVKDGEKVTYFVLQRLIAHHFPPSMSKLAAAAAAANKA
jgi:chromatin remodeling complex protein RSC6